MAKKSAIPENNREFPEYEYREFPKYVGGDEHGQPLIAQKPEDVEALLELKVYPKELGLNRDGKVVVANSPDEITLRMGEVVKPLPGVAEAAPARPTKDDVDPATDKPYTAAALKKAQAAWDEEHPQS